MSRGTAPSALFTAMLAAWGILAPMSSLAGTGEQYIPAYNELVKMTISRCVAAGCPTNGLVLKNIRVPGRDSVGQADLNILRSRILLLLTAYYVDPKAFNPSAGNSAREIFGSLADSLGRPGGMFLCVPGEFRTTGAPLYSDGCDVNIPVMMFHFRDLAYLLYKMQWTVRGGWYPPESQDCAWISGGGENQRIGGGASGSLKEALLTASNKYCTVAPSTVEGRAPALYTLVRRKEFYTSPDDYAVTMESLASRYSIGSLAPIARRVTFYGRARPYPAPTGYPQTQVWDPTGCPSPVRDKWAEIGRGGNGDGGTELSAQLGVLGAPLPMGGVPDDPASLGARYTYTTRGWLMDCAMGLIQWDGLYYGWFDDPGGRDSHSDGLVDAACECTDCSIEAQVERAGRSGGVNAKFPLGISSGRTTGGARVMAYVTEYSIDGVPRQMCSLDTSLTLKSGDADGWAFGTVKRPSGAEVVFSLCGSKTGAPADQKRSWRLVRTASGYELRFGGQRGVTHHFGLSGGRVGSVSIMSGNARAFAVCLRQGWPGLLVMRGARDEVVRTDTFRRSAIPVYTGDMVTSVTYINRDGKSLGRVTADAGSGVYESRNGNGELLSRSRVTAQDGAVDIARYGNSESEIAQVESVSVSPSTDGQRRRVVTTTVAEPGNSRSTSNRVEREEVLFPWGGEEVSEYRSSTGATVRVAEYAFHTNETDRSNYGRLKLKSRLDGFWTRYEYDDEGRVAREITPFKSTGPDSPEAACRVRLYRYAGDPELAGAGFPSNDITWPGDHRPRRVEERVAGHEVSRSYKAYLDDRVVSKECTVVGARYDDPSNLWTETYSVTSGVHAGRRGVVLRQDGSRTVYAYALNDATQGLTITEMSGAGEGMVVTSGVTRTTITDDEGAVVESSARDIASGIEIEHMVLTRDDFGRVVCSSNVLSGAVQTVHFDCCGPDRSTSEYGVVTETHYDSLRRVASSATAGVSSRYRRDVLGNVVETVVEAADGTQHRTLRSYDARGRVTSQTDELGNVTRWAQGTNLWGGLRILTKMPDGSERIDDFFRDGRPASTEGSGVHPVRYDYGAEDGVEITTTIQGGGTNATGWVRNRDYMGGLVSEVQFPDGYCVRRSRDPLKGITVESDGRRTVRSESSPDGRLQRDVLEMDGNESTDAAGNDRITEIVTSYGMFSGVPVRIEAVSDYPVDGSAVKREVRRGLTALSGLRSWEVTAAGTNAAETVVDRLSRNVTRRLTWPGGEALVSVESNGVPRVSAWNDRTGARVAGERLEYDGFGHRARHIRLSVSGAELVTEWTRDAAGRATNMLVAGGGAMERASVSYDSAGRVVSGTRNDGGVVRLSYGLRGELVEDGGVGRITTRREYDDAGRMVALSSFRGASSNAADTTRFQYDPLRGWPTGKTFADGKGPRAGYYPDGRIMTFTWARDVSLRYDYDAAGQMTNLVSSDGTHRISIARDRSGRIRHIRSGARDSSFDYNTAGFLIREHPGHLPGYSLAIEHDAAGRRTVTRLEDAGRVVASWRQRADAAGRLAGIDGAAVTAGYQYGEDGMSVTNVDLGVAGQTVMSIDVMGRLKDLRHAGAGGGSERFRYDHDLAGRRSSCERGDGYRWGYGYDALDQLTRAILVDPRGAPRMGADLEYAFDAAGNRVRANNRAGTRARPALLTVNGLNQLVERTVPDGVWVTGEAGTNAVVTVRTGGGRAMLANRQGRYFWSVAKVPNAEGVAAVSNTVTVVERIWPGGTNATLFLAVRRSVVPRDPEQFAYDDDGNLVRDGLFTYEWDARNQLISVTSGEEVPAQARVRIENEYDYAGRRVARRESEWDEAAGAYVPARTCRYLYNGWRPVLILEDGRNGSATNVFDWGLDLSGSIAGAAGIGGLLGGRRMTRAGDVSFRVLSDGSGNVTTVLPLDGGEPLAKFEYGPFGEPLRSTGEWSDFPFRFSTKIYDEAVGLVNFGYRFYRADIGRWISRDPIDNNEGAQVTGNLYRYCDNAPVNFVDPDGQEKGPPFDGSRQRNMQSEVGLITGLRVLLGSLGSVIDLDAFRSRGRLEFSSNAEQHCQFLLTVNGIWNSRQDAESLLRDWRMDLPGLGAIPNIGYVHNPTTYLTDIIQIGFLELGAIGSPSQTTAEFIRTAYGQAKKDCCKCIDIYVIAHSQGAAILNQALPLLSSEEKEALRILTIGAQQYVRSGKSAFGFVANVNSGGDLVPDLSPRNLFYKEIQVSAQDVPGHPHANYRKYFAREGVRLPDGYVASTDRAGCK